MLPKGFFNNGIHSGIVKNKSKKDLAVFFSEFPCRAYGMFTSNLVKAAPVILSQNILKSKRSGIRAIVANSGCANACTGEKGLKDARNICKKTAELLCLKENEILNASTGVIGQNLPVEKINKGIEKLARILGNSKEDESSAVKAIMTTDTFPKISSRSFKIGNKTINVWGCVKGAGMIHPDLKALHATMLCFILTDACISGGPLQKALIPAVENSFNCVSVDGDTSTNDTVFILANSAAENELIQGGRNFELFSRALDQVCLELAKMMAKDGEGATKLVEIEVSGAGKKEDAKKIASAVATSPLCKTAVFGNDANWGRIMAALGRAGVKLDPNKVDIKIGNILVTRKGQAAAYSEAKAKKVLQNKEVKFSINLNSGGKSVKYYTCDFSFDYIKINASYRS